MTVGERLKNARISRGKKVTDMTKLLNISDRGYRFYESDKRDLSTSVLMNICKYLNVSSAYILGLSSDMNVNYEEEWNKEAQEFADGMYEREQLLLRYLSEYFDDAEEKGIASDIVRYLPAFNNTGLKVVKERVEELTWIEKYINGPGR
jgi:transcriptional regulator with XRE-family HTH domain